MHHARHRFSWVIVLDHNGVNLRSKSMVIGGERVSG